MIGSIGSSGGFNALAYQSRSLDAFVDSVAKTNEVTGNQIKPTSGGNMIHTNSYADIITGKPIERFQPLFPSKDFVGGQVKEVEYNSLSLPQVVPYTSIVTGKSSLSLYLNLNPPAIGKNLDMSA